MRACLPALLALALSPLAPAEEKPPAKYESAGGGYRVRFPGEPTVETTPAQAGKPGQTTAVYGDEKAGRFYAVAVMDLPADRAEKFDLDRAVELGVGGWGMKATAVAKFEFGPAKLPARDVRARAEKGRTACRSHFAYDAGKRRLYVVYTSSENDPADGTFADGFLGSFELLPNK